MAHEMDTLTVCRNLIAAVLGPSVDQCRLMDAARLPTLSHRNRMMVEAVAAFRERAAALVADEAPAVVATEAETRQAFQEAVRRPGLPGMATTAGM